MVSPECSFTTGFTFDLTGGGDVLSTRRSNGIHIES